MKPALMLAAILLSSIAITRQQRPPQFDMKIQTTKLTDNLYLLVGAGGNVAEFIWDEGALLVDDKLAPASPDVKAAVAAITSKPIRFVSTATSTGTIAAETRRWRTTVRLSSRTRTSGGA